MDKQLLDYIQFIFLGECLRELKSSNNMLHANKEKVENDFRSTVTWLTKTRLSQDNTDVRVVL